MRYTFTLSIEPAERADDPTELYEDVWQALEKSLRQFLKGAAYRNVFADYLSSCRPEGMGRSTREELCFAFTDAAGTCRLWSTAVPHWFEVSATALREPLGALAALHGYRIATPPIAIEALLSRPVDEPLVETGKALSAIVRKRGEPTQTIDENGIADWPPPRLTGAARASILEAAASGLCRCAMCRKLREGAVLPKIVLPKRTVVSPECKSMAKALKHPLAIRELWIYNQQLGKIPPAIGTLARLEVLHASDNLLEALPVEIAALGSLRKLLVGHNYLTSLPAELGDLSLLEELEIGFNRLERIPESVTMLPALRELQAAWNHLTELPRAWQREPRLERIDIGRNPLSEVPLDLARMTTLRSLSLHSLPGARASILAFPFRRLTELVSLSLMHAELGDVPADVYTSRRLTYLSLCNNGLSGLAPGFSDLAQLEQLDLSKNRLTEVPVVVTALRGVKQLYIGENPISELPPALFEMRSLANLGVDDTPIETLPDAIGALTTLESINLDRTRLRRLPASLGGLVNLRRLSLRNTPLEDIPDDIARLEKLESLDVTGSRIDKRRLEALRRLLPRTSVRA